MIGRKYLKIDLSITFILKSSLSSVVMAFCTWLINPQSIALVIGSIFAGIGIYFTLLVLIKGLSKEEIAFFIKFARDNIKRIPIIK